MSFLGLSGGKLGLRLAYFQAVQKVWGLLLRVLGSEALSENSSKTMRRSVRPVDRGFQLVFWILSGKRSLIR
jgi:hypothetical protein